MNTLPSQLLDDQQRVSVTLSPILAEEVARSLRIQLAYELDRPFDDSLPTREDAGRLRTILDLCVDQLETLAWGRPSDDVQMIAPRRLLETIAQDLRDGGNETLADPFRNTPETERVRLQGLHMLRAAAAIDGALASSPHYQLAS